MDDRELSIDDEGTGPARGRPDAPVPSSYRATSTEERAGGVRKNTRARRQESLYARTYSKPEPRRATQEGKSLAMLPAFLLYDLFLCNSITALDLTDYFTFNCRGVNLFPTL